MIRLFLKKNCVHNVVLINIFDNHEIDYVIVYSENEKCPYVSIRTDRENVEISGFDVIVKRIEYIKNILEKGSETDEEKTENSAIENRFELFRERNHSV
jgi:arsenate reductase-like glutaredoxin family protein